ncbi:hypothetical protein [Roseovarius sp.]|uniref:hypothetical protein n=1 Tax=Roseovarius sp. TaxID=1486281 RepID=UPI003A97FA5C
MTIRQVSAILVLAVMMPGPAAALSKFSGPVDGVTTEFEHGGGCRKSSPPGQCCHMEKKTGRVHCH